jgi:hypothetical protein
VLFVQLLPSYIDGVEGTTQTYGIWVAALGLLKVFVPHLGPVTALFSLCEAIALTVDYQACSEVY